MNALKDEQPITNVVPLERPGNIALPFEGIDSVLDRVRKVVETKMVAGVDYGPAFPGAKDHICYQGGIDKLALEFNLVPRMERMVEDLGDGHKSYEFHCQLFDRLGNYVGDGWGSCNTMEESFALQFQPLGDVPKAYWDDKSPESERKKTHLGNCEFLIRKKTIHGRERWMFGRMIEIKPQYNYNNCMKRGQKRAWADAIYRRTAARNFFADVKIEEEREEDHNASGTPSPASPGKSDTSTAGTSTAGTSTSSKPSQTNETSGNSNAYPRANWNMYEKTLFKRMGIGLADGKDDLLQWFNQRGRNYENNDEIRRDLIEFLCNLSGVSRIESWEPVNRVEKNKEEFLQRFLDGNIGEGDGSESTFDGLPF